MKTAAFCFGRFQPPNLGHAVLLNTTKSAAIDWFVFTSKSEGNNMNPLSYSCKLQWLYTLHPDLNSHLIEDRSIKTFLEAASYLYSLGYDSIVFVVGNQDVNMFPVLGKYNNVAGKHGFYNFSTIRLVVSESPSGRSTQAREAAIAGDINTFMTITGVPAKFATQLMLDIQQGSKCVNIE